MKDLNTALLEAAGCNQDERDRWKVLQAIKRERESIETRQERCKTQYEKQCAALRAELAALQARCAHLRPLIEHHPDASGNNDSEDECLLCGKRAKKL